MFSRLVIDLGFVAVLCGYCTGRILLPKWMREPAL